MAGLGALTVDSYPEFFKKVYAPEVIANQCYAEKPFLGMVKKKDDFDGDSYNEYVKTANPQGLSHTFSNALSSIGGGQGEKFVLTRARDYGLLRINNEAWKAARKDIGAFFRLHQEKQDGLLEAMMDRASFELFEDGSALRGIVGSESTTDLTLATADDARNFELGMEVGVAAAGGSALRTGSATITGVNYETGVLTTDSNWTSQISALVATDEIYMTGDIDLGIKGLSAWCPSSAPGATSFFGVDRSVHPQRLGGLRYDGSSDLYVDAIRTAAYKAYVWKARGIKTGFVNPLVMEKIMKELDDKVQYTKGYAQLSGGRKLAHVDYDGIVISTPKGKIELFNDSDCQTDTIWLLNMDVLCFHHLDAFPHMTMKGWRDVEDQDEKESRLAWYGQLGCSAPGYLMRVTVADPTS